MISPGEWPPEWAQELALLGQDDRIPCNGQSQLGIPCNLRYWNGHTITASYSRDRIHLYLQCIEFVGPQGLTSLPSNVCRLISWHWFTAVMRCKHNIVLCHICRGIACKHCKTHNRYWRPCKCERKRGRKSIRLVHKNWMRPA